MVELTNSQKAEIYRSEFEEFKRYSLSEVGYFPIFSSFKKSKLLKKMSGNALKLYIFLGLSTDNWGGETWVSQETIAEYFGKRSTRTIRYWVEELEALGLIVTMQMEKNGVNHTFLRPYSN